MLDRYIKKEKMTFAVHNLGCKVNTYETDAMICRLKAAGYEETGFDKKADIYIINTCTVTNVADKKSRQMLHRARKMNPDAVVVAAGCYVDAALQNPEMRGLLEDKTVDIFISNKEKGRILEKLEGYLNSAGGDEKNPHPEKAPHAHTATDTSLQSKVFERNEAPEKSEKPKGSENPEESKKPEEQEKPGKSVSENSPFGDVECSFNMSLTEIENHTRAFIKVQDGCNQFCSYCIIPYVRGRIVSRPVEDCVSEIKKLSEKGVQEVVLTGIHLSSYGKDLLPGGDGGPVSDEDYKNKLYLLELIKAIHEIEGIRRIRLGSLEPHIITESFVREISVLDKFCPHFHLSLQSGSDTVLKRMNRHYTVADYKKRCGILRKYFEHPAVTTDVIVGFPGESEEEFYETYEFLKDIRFYEMHIFKYSGRAGTRAERMEGKIPESVKNERSEKLLRLAEEMSREFRGYYLGRELTMLPEEIVEAKDENGFSKKYVTGYTKEYVRLAKEAEHFEKGVFIKGKASDFCKEKAIYESILLS